MSHLQPSSSLPTLVQDTPLQEDGGGRLERSLGHQGFQGWGQCQKIGQVESQLLECFLVSGFCREWEQCAGALWGVGSVGAVE